MPEINREEAIRLLDSAGPSNAIEGIHTITYVAT